MTSKPSMPKQFQTNPDGLVVALSGGTGGAKLALGLSRVVSGMLLVVANTGDDFEHLGLHISPDVDTLTYALAGIDNPETGWGQKNETWSFMSGLAQLGGETWFKLGDRDLATHIERTWRLRSGEALSTITRAFAQRLGIKPCIVPMTDDRVRTRLVISDGILDFQEYFVHRQCLPAIEGIVFDGSDQATIHPRILDALTDHNLRAVIICPSNPFISIEPILSLPSARDAIASARAPVIAVSPLIGGQAVKGPTAKMMIELGLGSGVGAIAEHYRGIIDGFVVDHADAIEAQTIGVPILTTSILMQSIADREDLARTTLQFANDLASGHYIGSLREGIVS